MQIRHFILCLALIMSVVLCSAQEPRVSGDYQDIALSEILKDLKEQAEVRMAYDARSMRDLTSSLSIEQLPLVEALKLLLANTEFEAVYIKETWLIIPRPDSINKDRTERKRNFKVSGRLLDGHTGEPLAYANIALAGGPGGAISNLDGYFNIPEVDIDTIAMCISYVGFRTRCIDLGAFDTENMVIRLERVDTFLRVVEVKDRQTDDLSLSPIGGVVTMDAKAISRGSTGPQPDLFQAVKLLPGVASNDGIDSQLHIRGGEEDENLVLWDGFTLYHLDHFFGVFSTLNPSVIQQVSVHKDPYAAKYGGRSSGVLEVNGRSGNKREWRSRVDMNLINMGILTEGPVGDHSSFLFSFRRSHTDVLSSGLYEQILDRVFAESIRNSSESLVAEDIASDYFYHDLNFKWTSQLSPKDRMSLSIFQGGDSFERQSQYQFESEDSPFSYIDRLSDDSDWGNNGLGLVWTRNPKPGRSAYTSLGTSSYRSNFFFADEQLDSFNGLPLPRVYDSSLEQNNLNDLTLLHRRSRTLREGSIEYGYQFTYLEVEEKFTSRSFTDNITRVDRQESVAAQHGVFADRVWKLNKRLSFRGGGRVSSSSFTNSLYIEPRGRLDYWVNKDLRFYLASGNYIQQIRRVAEQNLFLRQADTWRMSDGEVLPESRSFHTALGMVAKLKPVELTLDVFYKQLKGVVINQEQNRILSSLTLEEEGLLSGDGETTGLDLLVHVDHRAHSAWLSYSYTLSRNVISEVNQGAAFPSAFNKPHDLKLVHNYRHKHYHLHTELIASSGYPYTPVLGFYNGPGGDAFLAYGDDLSARLPGFFRCDISLNRSYSLGKSDLEIGIGVYNVTDHKNVRSRSYAIAQDRNGISDDLRIKVVDLELIGISPTFSLILELR